MTLSKRGLQSIKFWTIKNIKQNLNINSLLFKNRLYLDDFGIAQAFNDHVTTIAERVREAMPAPSATVGYSQYMPNFSLPSSFFLYPVTSADVEQVIISLKNKKKVSTCMYSVQSLKVLSSLISPILSHLNNNSFTCGVFLNFFIRFIYWDHASCFEKN